MRDISIKDTFKIIIILLFLIVASTLSNSYKSHTGINFYNILASMLSTTIYLSIFIAWTASIYKRILQPYVRKYMVFLGVIMIFWIAIRTIKWYAFEFMASEDRMLWYMYYIPMLLIPLFSFFTALAIGKEENYRPSKKWQLLFIPAVILLVITLTNDLHGWAFTIDKTKHAYGQIYSHGIVYYITTIFIFLTVIATVVLLGKRCRTSDGKIPRLPMIVVLGAITYTAIYFVNLLWFINFVDMTAFMCIALMTFWEACIRSHLIPSNMGHETFFMQTSIGTQILNPNGSVKYSSKNATHVTPEQFQSLVQSSTIELDENKLAHMSPIHGGYVIWNSDVSDIRWMIEYVKEVNAKLYEEMAILTEESEAEEQSIKIEEQKSLHNLMLRKMYPHSEKVRQKVMEHKLATSEESSLILREISFISVYIKRKLNLIILAQTEACITTEEIRWAFEESFQILRFGGITCHLSSECEQKLPVEVAIYIYDLFENIVEKVRFNFSTVLISCRLQGEIFVFSIQIDPEDEVDFSELCEFDLPTLTRIGGSLEVVEETDNYYIGLKVSLNREGGIS